MSWLPYGMPALAGKGLANRAIAQLFLPRWLPGRNDEHQAQPGLLLGRQGKELWAFAELFWCLKPLLCRPFQSGGSLKQWQQSNYEDLTSQEAGTWMLNYVLNSFQFT